MSSKIGTKILTLQEFYFNSDKRLIVVLNGKAYVRSKAFIEGFQFCKVVKLIHEGCIYRIKEDKDGRRIEDVKGV